MRKRLAIIGEVATTTVFVLFMVAVFFVGMPFIMARDAINQIRSL